MRHTRLHCEDSLAEDAPLRLEADVAHYLGNVLRLRQGHCVYVFNAKDGEFVACIEHLGKKHAELRLGRRLREAVMPKLDIELCLGLSRGDRMTWAIQKSVELGVSRITPFLSARGEKKPPTDRSASRLGHWRRVSVSAVEQSGGFRIPDFSEPKPLDEILSRPPEPDRERLLFDPAGAQSLPEALPGNRLRIVTGPEGGFAEPERKLAARCGYGVVRLGPRVLRTETAPLAVLAIVQHRYGDMT